MAVCLDNPPPPRAKSMDTLLCLDVSDSIGLSGLEEVKQIANDFVDGKYVHGTYSVSVFFINRAFFEFFDTEVKY